MKYKGNFKIIHTNGPYTFVTGGTGDPWKDAFWLIEAACILAVEAKRQGAIPGISPEDASTSAELLMQTLISSILAQK